MLGAQERVREGLTPSTTYGKVRAQPCSLIRKRNFQRRPDHPPDPQTRTARVPGRTAGGKANTKSGATFSYQNRLRSATRSRRFICLFDRRWHRERAIYTAASSHVAGGAQ